MTVIDNLHCSRGLISESTIMAAAADCSTHMHAPNASITAPVSNSSIVSATQDSALIPGPRETDHEPNPLYIQLKQFQRRQLKRKRESGPGDATSWPSPCTDQLLHKRGPSMESAVTFAPLFDHESDIVPSSAATNPATLTSNHKVLGPEFGPGSSVPTSTAALSESVLVDDHESAAGPTSDNDVPGPIARPALRDHDQATATVTSALVPPGPGPVEITVTDHDTSMQQYFCSSCQNVRPTSAFFPSYLERRVYMCKACSNKKLAATRTLRRQADLNATGQRDHAFHMVDRFRRRCASEFLPPNWNGHAGRTQQAGLRLSFGAKIARMLLKFWNNTSALQLHLQASPTKSHRSGQCTGQSDRNTSKQSTYRSVSEPTPLMFMLWSKTDVWEVEPWQCIPVTRDEAAAFRKVPMHLRSELLAPAKASEISNKLYDLYRLCTTQRRTGDKKVDDDNLVRLYRVMKTSDSESVACIGK